MKLQDFAFLCCTLQVQDWFPDLDQKQAGRVMQRLKCKHSGEVMIDHILCCVTHPFQMENIMSLLPGWKDSLGVVGAGDAVEGHQGGGGDGRTSSEIQHVLTSFTFKEIN